MVHVIVVSKDEARDVVLAELRERGYQVLSETTTDGTKERGQGADVCSDRCSPEKVAAVFEERFADSRREKGLYRFVLDEIEKSLIKRALEKTGGNQLAAARMLGINRNTIRSKIRRLGIQNWLQGQDAQHLQARLRAGATR